MNTLFMLMGQFGMRPVIPVDEVRREYFPHLEIDKLLRKITIGEIALPLVRIENSQKTAKGVPITALADYIDKRIDAAKKECDQLAGVV